MAKYSTLVSDIEKDIHKDHKQTLESFKSKGEIDGRTNSPDGNFDGLSPAENSIRATYQGYLSRFKARTNQIIGGQEIEFQHIGSDLNELRQNPSIIKNRIDELTANVNRNKLDETNRHNTKITQIYQDPKYTNAKAEYHKLDNSYNDLATELGRTLPILPQIWYYPLLILIGISEFYLNYTAFSSQGGNVLETMIMALSAGIVFPVLAHYVGKILRQGKRTKANIGLLTVLFSMATALAIFLAKQVVNFGIQTQNITNDGEANTTFAMRILIVLGIFAIGCLISFFNHEPSVNFLDTYNLRLKAKVKFEKIEKSVTDDNNAEKQKYEANFAAIEKELQAAIHNENSRISQLSNKFREAERDLVKTKDYQKHTIETINQWYILTTNEYRSENSIYRTQKAPKSWEKEPEDLKN
jgi:hypothetical protein